MMLSRWLAFRKDPIHQNLDPLSEARRDRASMRAQEPLHNANPAASRDRSTSMCSKTCSVGSTKMRRPCVGGARRSPVRYDQSTDGCDALPDEDAAEGCERDGALRARLQFDLRQEYRLTQLNSRDEAAPKRTFTGGWPPTGDHSPPYV